MIEFSCVIARPRFSLDATFSASGGCLALFGASGSGKTTIAKLIAGLEWPDRGRIVIADRTLVDTERRIRVPVYKRRVGFVFQEGQLLPHLSVRQNLDYGRHFAKGEPAVASFATVVDLLGIGHLLEARPATLSGGERQRVAIGRALLASPRILVMDEPLASLDAERKREILPFVERLRDELALPLLYISHAIDEVARLATQVVRLSAGRVIAQGTPAQVFAGPIGDLPPEDAARHISFLTGRVTRYLPEFGMTVLDHPAGEITVPSRPGASADTLRVAVPAANVTLAIARADGLSVRTSLQGRIERIVAAGPSALVSVELVGGDRIVALVTQLAVADLGLAAGQEVYALLKATAIDEEAIAAF